MNYYNRLWTYLSDNPKLRLTPAQIAGIWKRSKFDVEMAAFRLRQDGIITKLKNGAIKLA